MPRASRKAQEEHLASRDPVLGALIAATRLPPLRRASRVPGRIGAHHFETLLTSIICQQISDRAAAAIAGRFRALYGGRAPSPEELLATPVADLRGAGLSGAKAAYLRDLAARVRDGRLDLAHIATMPDEEAMRELVAVKGIGPWTAEMFLIFSLGRPDVFSFGDVGLINAMTRLYRLRKPASRERLARIVRRWAPYRSLAARYLWASLDGSGNAWS